MNKNVAIFILVVLIFIGAIWGSLADRKRIVLEKQLKETVAQMEKMTAQNTRQQEHVLGKTAGLQETLADKEEQLDKARKELVSLRKDIKAVESELSGCNVNLQQLTREKEALLSAASGGTEAGKGGAVPETAPGMESAQAGQGGAAGPETVQSLQEKLQISEVTVDKLRQQLDGANAQMKGLDKLLEEKGGAMDELSRQKDRLEINMDVLIAKIAEQRDQLQGLQEEKRNLVKELAAKDKKIGELQDEVMRHPVQE